MSLEKFMTGDGSHSIATGTGVTYHSRFGALQESRHIFIEAGLLPMLSDGAGDLHIFEMGFGTGLNALLTLMEAERRGSMISYETVELAPLGVGLVSGLNYCERLGKPELRPIFGRLHMAPWEQEVEIVPGFRLLKVAGDVAAYRMRQAADLIYYDAFDPMVQPELWGEEVFRWILGAMRPGGVLVTYCCKGSVRRAMEAAGFKTEKLPGPPGKREILKATKTSSSLPHPFHL